MTLPATWRHQTRCRRSTAAAADAVAVDSRDAQDSNITDRSSEEGDAIDSVRLSIRLFSPHLLNRVTYNLNFFMYMGHDHSSLPGIEGQEI